jgi:N-acetylglucosamine-6-sulfatase
MHNLIDNPEYLAVKIKLRKALFERLAVDGEHAVPYTKKWSSGAVFRQADRSKAAEFPDHWLRKGNEKDLTKFFFRDNKKLKNGNN